uniref:G_PROTEIN_RECEP_F1_2 domain-containing protein n=1 Tax=Rhabditophanes sp. KR3021 TaxID=114890 RepID=A0AC35TGA5_9BILA
MYDYINIMQILITTLAIILNAIAIVLTYQAKIGSSFKTYKQILIVQFSLGIVSVVVTAITRVRVISLNNYFIVSADLFDFDKEDVMTERVILFFTLIFIYINVPAITLVVICRYIQVCHSKRMSYLQISTGIICTIIASITLATGLTACYDKISDPFILAQIYLEIKNKGIITGTKKVLLGISINPKMNLITLFIAIVFYAANYIVIITCYKKYCTFVNKRIHIMTSKTKELNLVFMKIIKYQCFTPWLFTGIPELIFNILFFFDVDIHLFGALLYYLILCVAILNPTLFIILSPTNRTLIYKWIT